MTNNTLISGIRGKGGQTRDLSTPYASVHALVFSKRGNGIFFTTVDSTAACVMQYAAFKGKKLRPGAVCVSMNEQYASKA